MSHIALIGGTGRVGQRILREALDRGHQVTVIARRQGAEPLPEGATFVQGDVSTDAPGLATQLRGHDVLVSSARFVSASAADVLAVARGAGIQRLLVVGGAGSLEVAPGQRLLDTPDFPEAYRPEASGGARFLDSLHQVDDLDWSYLSPAVLFDTGERTGKFRLGTDALMTDAEGKNRISFEDYAIALLDEIEHPAHLRQRFSIAY